MNKLSYFIFFVCVLLLSSTYKLSAQYSGTSYLQAGSGVGIQHQDDALHSPKLYFHLTYGYILSHRLTVDVPLSYQSLENKFLTGEQYSLAPSLYYAFHRTDKSRLEIGAIVSIGYEHLKQKDLELLDITGKPSSFTLGTGAGIRYSYMIQPTIGIGIGYRFMNHYQGQFRLHHSLGGFISIYL